MESPNLQSAAASAVLPDCCQHNGIPGKKPAPFRSFLHSVDGLGMGRRAAPEEEQHLDNHFTFLSP